jgi:hypothetical protein
VFDVLIHIDVLLAVPLLISLFFVDSTWGAIYKDFGVSWGILSVLVTFFRLIHAFEFLHNVVGLITEVCLVNEVVIPLWEALSFQVALEDSLAHALSYKVLVVTSLILDISIGN